MGKLVTLKDIHNLRARASRVGTDEWAATVQKIDKFLKADPGAVVDVLVREDTQDFEIMIIQSSDMRANLQKFPEVLQLWPEPVWPSVVCIGSGRCSRLWTTRSFDVYEGRNCCKHKDDA